MYLKKYKRKVYCKIENLLNLQNNSLLMRPQTEDRQHDRINLIVALASEDHSARSGQNSLVMETSKVRLTSHLQRGTLEVPPLFRDISIVNVNASATAGRTIMPYNLVISRNCTARNAKNAVIPPTDYSNHARNVKKKRKHLFRGEGNR